MRMLQLILHFHNRAARVVAKGCPIFVIHGLPVVNALTRMKTGVPNEQVARMDEIQEALDEQIDQLERDYA
jgi:hypothetical protein